MTHSRLSKALESSPPVDNIMDDRAQPAEGAQFPVVGVGASAGGLEAFTQLLSAMPVDTGMAFVFVQHLAPTHASALAHILSRATTMPVMEVQEESKVEPNHVYVIPPGQDMVISGGTFQLVPRRERAPRRPVDQFFRALAEDRRHRAIGVVLSGTASDGTIGLEAIKAEGGITFAQDDSAQHDGMPKSAIASGCVDYVLSPDEIAREIVRIGHHRYAAADTGEREASSEPNFVQILQLLRHASGVDFTHYKFNTLYRRVTRRLVLQRMEGLDEYVRLLRGDRAELEALYQDILISVTSFFRDPEAIETLKDRVFSRFFKERSRQDPIRVWTVGCSTGQEAYSLAIALGEFAETTGSDVPIQLFATDLNGKSIETARAGVYPRDIAQDVSTERLRRFFVEVDGGYRISKAIRDVCVFSRHNVLTDPPFSRIDIISCRNMLIYMEPVLQQKIMRTLHYALKPVGCLWLGVSETIGGYASLFEVEDAKQKIYCQKPGAGSVAGLLSPQHGAVPRSSFAPIASRPIDGAAELYKEADRVLLTKFSPPGVLISADLDILQYRGDTGAYLAPMAGKASLSLLKMLREGLIVAVRAAILKARKESAPVREGGLRVKSNGGYREVAVEVIPVKAGDGKEGGFLVLFEDATVPDESSLGEGRAKARRKPAGRASSSRAEPPPVDPDTARLAQELLSTREFLQSVIERQEAANEELQSANEEVQSANEELQSINEELETSREEIQSSSEELASVNDELNNRNAELNGVNSDLVNLLGSVQMAIVMLGPDFRVRRFTPTAAKLLNLVSSDVGRPLGDINLNLDNLPDLQPLLVEVIDTVSPKELDVRDTQGRRYSLRLRPYKTVDNRIDGVVIVLVDVDLIKRAHEYTESIVATVREPLIVLDADLHVRTANLAFYETFHVVPDEAEGRLLYDLGNGQWSIPDLRRLLDEVLHNDTPFSNFEVQAEFERIGKKAMVINARRLIQEGGKASSILLAIEDVTDREESERALRESEERLRTLADNMAQFAWTADAEGRILWYNKRWYDYTGTTLEEVQGWGWKKIQHPDHVDRVVGRIQLSWDTGEPWEDVFPLRGRDGEYRWYLSRAVPIRDEEGKVVRWFGTSTDVTDERKLEEDLRRYAAELSESDRRKNEFLAMLAHELRNPLAPIRNALEIMRLTAGEAWAAHPASEIIERQVTQMVRLVDDLLDVSRISRGKIEVRKGRIELASAVNHAIEAARPAIVGKGLDLTVTMPTRPLYLEADPIRMAQVVGNLLNNAYKFTDRGGRIALTVEPEGEHAVIRVRDSGIGIAADQRSRIFDLFVQIDTSLQRSVSGLGIGLTLVRNLVELHGGTVEVDSAGIGEGSEFVVRVPMLMETDVRPVPVPTHAEPTMPTGRRILVVDDNEDAASSLATLLELSGNATRVAGDGILAVALAAEFKPDVVLLDIGLPKLHGYEVARRIRLAPGGEKVVLVALTGWGQEQDRQKSREAGLNGHLVKPVDHGALAKLLRELLAVPDEE